MKQKKELFLLTQTEKYHRLIENTFRRLEKEKFDKFLKPLFVMACSSGLEYFLNSIFIDFSIKEFRDYRDFANGYISLNFKSKLLLAAPTVTKNEMIFNENNGDLKTLKRLIGRRNEILHNKDFLAETGIVIESQSKEKMNLQVRVEDLKKALKNHIDFIEDRECKYYKKAIDTFCNDFLFPYNTGNLKVTEFLISNKDVATGNKDQETCKRN